MALEVNGKTIATTANGYLEEINDWSEEVAEAIAAIEGIELTEQHWDVIKHLRNEHINNGGNEPMERALMKDMGKIWGKKPSSKELYVLFPLAPTKQGRKLAGLPQSTRKGGY
jgi:tRNA 2-thiouridine synthesizing protein E